MTTGVRACLHTCTSLHKLFLCFSCQKSTDIPWIHWVTIIFRFCLWVFKSLLFWTPKNPNCVSTQSETSTNNSCPRDIRCTNIREVSCRPFLRREGEGRRKDIKNPILESSSTSIEEVDFPTRNLPIPWDVFGGSPPLSMGSGSTWHSLGIIFFHEDRPHHGNSSIFRVFETRKRTWSTGGWKMREGAQDLVKTGEVVVGDSPFGSQKRRL